MLPAVPATNPALAAAQKRQRVKMMLAEARAGKYEARRSRRLRTAALPLGFLLGAKIRFLLGSMSLVACVLWAQQNGMVVDQIQNKKGEQQRAK
jgi:hypothetical protein